MENYTPKYITIRNFIIENIHSGDLQIGDKIPSENKLSEMFSVSRVTANTAIRELSTLGFVDRIQGKGTYVKSKGDTIESRRHNVTKSIKISSETVETRIHKLEKIQTIKSDIALAKQLNIQKDEKVHEIVRFMKKEKMVTGIDYSYIPYKYMENIDIDFNHLTKSYLHEFISNSCGISVTKIHMHLNAKLPSEYEMEIFEFDQERPLVVWETNILNEQGLTIAFTNTVVDPERYMPFINFDL